MSRALKGEHLCLQHQGNHSHYAEENCVICKQEKRIVELKSNANTIDIDGLKVGPCMVRGYIERIAELEREIEELNEVAAIIDHQRDMERVIRYNASLKELEKMSKDTPEHIYLQGASTWSEEKKSDGDDKYILASRANAELLTAMENQDIVLKSIIETYTKKIGAAYLSGINEGNRRCFEIAEKIGNEETAEAIYNQDVVKYDEIKDQIDSIRNTKNY